MNHLIKTHLGDGLQACDDGLILELSADRGGFRHSVYLDSAMLIALLRFVESARGVEITVARAKRKDGKQ